LRVIPPSEIRRVAASTKEYRPTYDVQAIGFDGKPVTGAWAEAYEAMAREVIRVAENSRCCG
jgi:hypothetical protein